MDDNNFIKELLDSHDQNVDKVNIKAPIRIPGRKTRNTSTGCKPGYSRSTIIIKKKLYAMIKYFSYDQRVNIYDLCEKIFVDFFKKPENKELLSRAKDAIEKGFI